MKKKQKIKIFRPKRKTLTEDDEINKLEELYNEVDPSNVQNFEDLPISQKTLKGLRKHNFIKPTEIQRDSILYSLRGEDVLGAAKTGSGKTLAFLIPLLEKLYCNKWTRYDGVGAVVITPTRELAYQIFETLKRIGEFHEFSAGLIIGGKDLKFESKRMDQCNIVICTPGRLLQHMDENPLLDCSTMKILILDEADRCLDMGFERTMNSIIENLPEERQTLLFSATQTKSVKDLARLSLTEPRYISVHEDAKFSTPAGLVQSYIICELPEKMNFLWSFIKSHKSQKILIFLSSCKQVKYTHEVLCRMKPGVSLLALYGSLHQTKRMTVYDTFCHKQHAVLFATDIAARGLDFPAVNWVLQLDCPESANEYIHRAGRTARYQKSGESLLVLLPSELKMLEHLQQKKIPIEEIQVNMTKLQNIQRNLDVLLARDNNLKESAQRAFVAYIKSVFLMKDKEVFNVSSLDTDTYAKSLGLAISPRIRFLQKRQKMVKAKQDEEQQKLIDKMNEKTSENEKSEQESETELEPEPEPEPKHEPEPETKPKSKKNIWNTPLNFYDDEDDDDDFMYLKRTDHELKIQPLDHDQSQMLPKKSKKPTSKAALVKKMLKKKILPNKKTVFDDEGEVILNKGKEYVSDLAREYEKSNEAGIDIKTAQQVLREEDKHDKELFKKKIKQKHKEERLRQKAERTKKEPKESDSEEEEPDLSWLPDVDKFKSSKSDESEVGSESEEDLSNESEEPVEPIKMKRKAKIKIKLSKKRKVNHSDEEADNYLDTGLSLADDEEIALQMMNAA